MKVFVVYRESDATNLVAFTTFDEAQKYAAWCDAQHNTTDHYIDTVAILEKVEDLI